MENSVCKIIKDCYRGTGFLCIIPFPNINSKFPTLITVNHLVNEDDISKGKLIFFVYGNGGCYQNKIRLNDSRKILTDRDLDVTIIEIKKSDKIKSDYLELDKQILNNDDNFINNFEDIVIYIIGYGSSQTLGHSVGSIKEIDNDEHLSYYCSNDSGSTGSPIMNLSNFKVIGIHTSGKYYISRGVLLKNAIKKFLNKFG